MAIQNFLSGGYYGKLGATVGQRWKNKRTIRSYVIPRNPRTEEQQANRGKFGDAVKFSQMGLQMNYYATCFESETLTKWNYRMATARALKNAHLIYLDLIPLYPINFNPPTLLTALSVSSSSTPGHITLSAPDLVSESDRVLSVMIAEFTALSVFIGYKLYVGYYYASNPGFIEIDVDDNSEFNERTLVRIISNDDTNSANDMIASPMLDLSGGHIVERDFNSEILGITKTQSSIIVKFAEPFRAFSVGTLNIGFSAVSAGENVTVAKQSCTFANVDDFFGVVIPNVVSDTQSIPAFPSGSSVNVDGFEVQGTGYIYRQVATDIPFSDSDLSRNVSGAYNFSGVLGGLRGTVHLAMGDKTVTTASAQMLPGGQLDANDIYMTTWTLSVSNGSIAKIQPESRWLATPMRAGNWVSIPAISTVLNGVTYNIPALTQQEVINNFKTSAFLTYEGTYRYNKDEPIGSEITRLMINISDIVLDGTVDPTLPAAPATLQIREGSNYTNAVLDSCEEDSSEINLYFDVENPAETVSMSGNATVEYIEGMTYFTYKGIEYEFNISNLPKLGSWNN